MLKGKPTYTSYHRAGWSSGSSNYPVLVSMNEKVIKRQDTGLYNSIRRQHFRVKLTLNVGLWSHELGG